MTSSSRYSAIRTLSSRASSCYLYFMILGLLLPLKVSGRKLELNAGVGLNEELDDDNCFQKSLEEQEEEASIIFTGTVHAIYPHRKHFGQTKAHVEVKRILKGRLVEEGNPGGLHTIVIVDGLDNPKICHSSAKQFDTRIFFVNGNGNELKLSSSLIRITPSNLEQVEAAVKGKLYQQFVNKSYEIFPFQNLLSILVVLFIHILVVAVIGINPGRGLQLATPYFWMGVIGSP